MYTFAPPDKTRPVVILTRPVLIPVLTYVTVAYVTSTIREIPSEVLIGMDEGLPHPSSINLNNIFTVRKSALKKYVGTVGPDKMHRLCQSLAHPMGCS